MKKAVLFITFNRLDYSKEVFNEIRKAKPPRLYLASDGPRENVEKEKEAIEEVRNWILDNIDWECEVKTKFRDKNVGCGINISQAVTWFFENEEDGIILEDDCVPSQTFFKYCEVLLDKYKDNKQIWHIGGHASTYIDKPNTKETYWFGKIMMCWGWASWRDRWQHYNFSLDDYDEKNLENFSDVKEIQIYWRNILNQMKEHDIDTWDYQWTFWIVSNKGLCINPYNNLVTNIGKEGVHYSGNSPHLFTQRYELNKIVHPKRFKFDEKMVDLLYLKHFNINFEIDNNKYSPFSFIYKKERSGNKRKVILLNCIKISYKKRKSI